MRTVFPQRSLLFHRGNFRRSSNFRHLLLVTLFLAFILWIFISLSLSLSHNIELLRGIRTKKHRINGKEKHCAWGVSFMGNNRFIMSDMKKHKQIREAKLLSCYGKTHLDHTEWMLYNFTVSSYSKVIKCLFLIEHFFTFSLPWKMKFRKIAYN